MSHLVAGLMIFGLVLYIGGLLGEIANLRRKAADMEAKLAAKE